MSYIDNQSGLVNWDTVDIPKAKYKINYLRMKGGGLGVNTYKMRLFRNPKRVLRYYVDGKSAICGNPDTCPVQIKHGITPKSRFAIIVIDRADGEVKVTEAPAGVFMDFRKYYVLTGRNPGGAEGVDFTINVSGEGIGTRYEVIQGDKVTPFTAEEEEKLNAAINGDYKLDEIFRPTDLDKIESILYGNAESESKKVEDKISSPQSPQNNLRDKGDIEWAK